MMRILERIFGLLIIGGFGALVYLWLNSEWGAIVITIIAVWADRRINELFLCLTRSAQATLAIAEQLDKHSQHINPGLYT